MKEMTKKLVERIGALGTKRLRGDSVSLLHDIKSLNLLPDLNIGYIPWSSFAIRPSALTMMLNELLLNKRKTVIECGIGISTLYFLSQSIGKECRLVGIDDDFDWIQIVKTYLDKMNIPEENYYLIHAPIVNKNDQIEKWYDVSKIDLGIRSFMGDEQADMLVVDGPKGSLSKDSRYNALPVLNKYLSQDSIVFLDDIHREDESRIAKLWANEFNRELIYHIEKGGIAVLSPKASERKRTVT